jgi:hypothetical protein
MMDYGERLQRALDAFPAPGPREEFRAGLRARFLGAADDAGDAPATAAPRGTRGARRARPAGVTSVARAPRRRLRLVALAAAVALVALWSLHGAGDPAAWRVHGGDVAALRVDGAALPAGLAPDEVARRIGAAAQVSAQGAGVRLRAGDLFVIELSAGSTLDLSGVSGDLRGDIALAMAGETGSFRVSTGPGFGGGRTLSFRTPEAEVTVLGTAFGVDRYVSDDPSGSGTCICCCAGVVRAVDRRRRGAEMRIAAESMAFVFAGEEPLVEGPVIEDHAAPIERLMEVW